MRRTLRRESACVVAFMVLLGAMAAVSAPASTPLVPISKLSLVDTGSEVKVQGLLVDLWRRDDGAETLVLLDPREDATVRVFCPRGVGNPLSGHAHIGDMVVARGEVSSAGPSPVIYADGDGVEIVEEAGSVLTVTILARSWSLFEGDQFAITGVLEYDPFTGSARLSDSSLRSSIELRHDESMSRFGGLTVTVGGTLVFDTSRMSLYLDVESVSVSE